MATQPVRILFDAQRLFGTKTGVEYYTAGMVENLAKLHPGGIQLIGYHSGTPTADAALPAAPNISYRRVWMPMKVINLLRRSHLPIPIELLTLQRADFILFPNFLGLPSLFRTPHAPVVHDLTYVDLPDYVAKRNLHDLRTLLPGQVRAASFVITVSEFGKQRICDTFRIPKRNVLVTPVPPKTPHLASPEVEASTLARFGITTKYILSVGTIEPRKNLLNMLAAYLRLPEETQRDNAFVIVGKTGWNCDTEMARIAELQQQGKRIFHVGYVSDEELGTFYHNAALLAQASHYEGFGMPILEAMSYGIPCAVSNIPVFKEFAGDAALYFDEKRPEAIAKTWLQLLNKPELHTRLAMSGLQQAESYQWDNVATTLYNRIMKTLEAR